MRKSGLLIGVVLLLALASTALAGGWAVITLDDMPGEIHAGEPWNVGFRVLQHGVTPAHVVFDGQPVEPMLIATNKATGEKIEVAAKPSKEAGHFTVEVTFPSDGTWEWTIDPAPLLGETVFEPLNILPAVVAVEQPELSTMPVSSQGAAGSYPVAQALRWGALALVLAAAALMVLQGRRSKQQAAEIKS